MFHVHCSLDVFHWQVLACYDRIDTALQEPHVPCALGSVEKDGVAGTQLTIVVKRVFHLLRHDCIALDDSGNQCWRNTNALGDFLSEVADI